MFIPYSTPYALGKEQALAFLAIPFHCTVDIGGNHPSKVARIIADGLLLW